MMAANSSKNKISLNRHLLSGQMYTAVAVLFICTVAYFANDYFLNGEIMDREIQATSTVLMGNLHSSIRFHDQKDAQKVLSSLSGNPDYISAFILLADNSVFASYVNGGLSSGGATEANADVTPKKGARHDEFLIKDGNEALGKLVLISEDRHFRAQILRGFSIAVVVAIMGLILAFLLARHFSRSLSESIQDLISVIRKISDAKDFSLRVSKEHGDPNIQ